MNKSVVTIILLCGLGTFLLRWLPLWHARRAADRASTHAGRWRRLFEGVGPAAIAALLAVSLAGYFPQALAPARAAGLILALAAVAASKRWIGGIAWPTLVGALAYGVAMRWVVPALP